MIPPAEMVFLTAHTAARRSYSGGEEGAFHEQVDEQLRKISAGTAVIHVVFRLLSSWTLSIILRPLVGMDGVRIKVDAREGLRILRGNRLHVYPRNTFA